MPDSLSEQINALLPQTQCQKCGFQGCQPYAQAISQGQADINRCPPGGQQGIAQLADLLGVAVKPLDPACGEERPRLTAVINEAECIGCTKCIPPCPVDAILGASKLMHSVLTELCTGCELCVAPCPVNCISMETAKLSDWSREDAERARQRHDARNQRIARQEAEKAERLRLQKLLIAQQKSAKTPI